MADTTRITVTLPTEQVNEPLRGHTYAIDATVAEMALRQPGPVAILTSDVDDMARLAMTVSA